jgi:hypothetical protein
MRSGNARNLVWQALVVLHRYLGVAVGLLMVMWFVSGIVMMYVGLPSPDISHYRCMLERI